jgi:hypothetical protein
MATAESPAAANPSDPAPGHTTTSTLAPFSRATAIAGSRLESPETMINTSASSAALTTSTASATLTLAPTTSTTWKPNSRITCARLPSLDGAERPLRKAVARCRFLPSANRSSSCESCSPRPPGSVARSTAATSTNTESFSPFLNKALVKYSSSSGFRYAVYSVTPARVPISKEQRCYQGQEHRESHR